MAGYRVLLRLQREIERLAEVLGEETKRVRSLDCRGGVVVLERPAHPRLSAGRSSRPTPISDASSSGRLRTPFGTPSVVFSIADTTDTPRRAASKRPSRRCAGRSIRGRIRAVASGQHLRDERLDRDRAVAGYGARGQRTVAEHVVAQLDQLGPRQRPVHAARRRSASAQQWKRSMQMPSPAISASVMVSRRRVGDVDVGVQARRVLDRQATPACRAAGAHGVTAVAEPVGGAFPGEVAPSSGQHVDHPRTYRVPPRRQPAADESREENR